MFVEAMKVKISRKWFILGIPLFLGICSTLCFLLRKTSEDKVITARLLTKENGYFVPMKINGFSPGNIPYFTVNIENQTIIAKIDLGYEGHIALSSGVIKELNAKKFIRRRSNYGLKGRTRECDIYEVEKIHTESMSFYPVLADEIGLEFERDANLGEEEKILKGNLGRVGWCLFQNFNLLVDCENSTLALCDSLETLKNRGYPVDSFTETPLLLDRGFIEFEAQTKSGTLRCVLDSGSTWNMLNKDLNDSYNSHIIFTPENVDQYLTLNPENKNLLTFDSKNVHDVSVFNIGGKEFGPITFNRIKSPMAIDAIMGMEFLEDTLIFIDFSNHKIYFFEYPEKENTVPVEHSTVKAAN
jgi:hypothetical protein